MQPDTENRRPVILLAFANDRDDRARYLRNLPEEARRLRDALKQAEIAGQCEVVPRPNVVVPDIFDAFQDPRYRDRVAIFHYGGHADGYRLLLESPTGQPVVAHAAGLASFLGQQHSLQLVFLNGCSTGPQVKGLLDAGVAAVISTSQAIRDEVATEFAGRFYTALGAGGTILRAFNEAAGAVTTERGDDTRAFFRDEKTAGDCLPWELRPDGAEVGGWSIPKAADDPTYVLPPLPKRDLPESRFLKPLARYTAEEAEVFFGRGYQIRELYDRATDSDGAPILLLCGQSGVGKSSLLDAGLLPRLFSGGRDVRYLRRDQQKGLLGTLSEALRPTDENPSLGIAWRAEEARLNRPLVVLLDQVEEAFTRPNPSHPREVEELAAALREALGVRSNRPNGKLILSFRKEWLADIERSLDEARLLPARVRVFLGPLDRRGIIEAVRGPGRLVDPHGHQFEHPILADRLYKQYALEVEAGLPEVIADDLLADPGSPVAPTLQVLLCKMWEKAQDKMWEKARERDRAHPCFDRKLYGELSREGILLKDYLDQQLAELGQWRPEVMNLGLALDLLEYHTTPLGTAKERTAKERHEDYIHLDEVVPSLVQQCVELRLLATDGTQVDSNHGEPATRLAHDTLAPLVRDRFDSSDCPAQRARRVLKNRAAEWAEGKEGAPLDEADLAVVERAESAMRAWTPDEKRLVEASRRERNQREQGRLRALVEPLLRSLGHTKSLWDLACLSREDEHARVLFLELALKEPGTAWELANPLEPAVHAAVGLSPDRRLAVLDKVVLHVLGQPATDPRIHWVCARVGIALGAHEEKFVGLASEALARYVESKGGAISDEVLVFPLRLSAAAAERIAEELLVAMSKASGSDESKRLVKKFVAAPQSRYPAAERIAGLLDFEAVVPQLPAPAAERIADRLLDAMDKTSDLKVLSRLAANFAAMAPRLPAPTAERIAERLLDAMDKTSDSNVLSRLAANFGAVTSRLPAPSTERAADRLLDAMAIAKTSYSYFLDQLAGYFAAEASRLPAPAAERIADRLLDAMDKISRSWDLGQLPRSFAAVAPRLPAPAAERIADRLLDAMEKTSDSDVLSRPAESFGAVAPQLPAPAAERIADRLLDAMEKTSDSDVLSRLAGSFGAVAPQLPAPAAERIADRLLDTMEKTSDSDVLSRLAYCFWAVASRVPAPTAERAADRLLDAMAKTSDTDALKWLAECIAAMASRLPAPTAERAADRLLDAMEKTSDSNVLSRLAGSFGAVASRLPAPVAERIADRLLDAMEKTSDSKVLWGGLVACFAAVAPQLPAPAAERIADRLLDAMEKTSDSKVLNRLAANFAAMAPQLPAPAAERIAERLLDAMEKTSDSDALKRPAAPRPRLASRFMTETSDSDALARLAGNFAAVAPRLPAPVAERAAERIAGLLDAMGETRDSGILSRLAEYFGAVAPQLPAPTAERIAERLLYAMPEARDSNVLSRLVACFGAVAPRLPAPVAERIAERLLDAMPEARYSGDLGQLIACFGAVAPRLPTPAAERILDTFANKYYWGNLSSIVPALSAVADKCDVRTIINILKFPLCVGPLRKVLLLSLERRTGKTFGGDIWCLVEQADALGLGPDDLSSPPVRSLG